MKIGISLDNTLNERWNKEIVIIKKRIQDAGGEVIVKTAFGLADSQSSDLRDLVTLDKVDVVVIVPVNAKEAGKMAEFAQSNGVGVIAYSRPIPSEAVDFHVRFDVKALGRNQADYLVKKQPYGKYLIVHGPTSDLNTGYLLEGQLEVLNEYKSKGLEILDIGYLDGWTKMKASMLLKQLLAKHGEEVTAILAANDMIAEAAYDILYELDKGNVLITGLDAEVKACQRILNKQQAMTILLPPNDIAQCVANIALYLAQKEDKYISEYEVVYDEVGEEKISTKCINIQSVVLDQNNVREKVDAYKLFPAGWLK